LSVFNPAADGVISRVSATTCPVSSVSAKKTDASSYGPYSSTIVAAVFPYSRKKISASASRVASSNDPVGAKCSRNLGDVPMKYLFPTSPGARYWWGHHPWWARSAGPASRPNRAPIIDATSRPLT
jgi:hypothetical protein